jgi:WD40 repeat protein
MRQFPLRGSTHAVTGVGLSPDGARAISLGSDGTLVVWDVATEREVARTSAHAGNAAALALSADGRYALTGARDGRARLWAVPALKEVGGAPAHTGAVSALVIDASDPARPLLRSAGQEGGILSWSLPAGSSQAPVVPAPEAKVSWNPPPLPQGGDPPLRHMVFARAGALLLVSERERLTAFRSASGEKLWEYATPNGADITSVDAASTSTGRVVALTGGAGALLDLDTGRPCLSVPSKSALWLMALSADEKWLAVSDYDGALWIADATTGKAVRSLAGHAGGQLVSDGETITRTVRSAATAAAFSRDGALLATLGGDRALRVWVTATGTELGSFEVSERDTRNLATFSPDGSLIAVADDAGRLFLLDSRRVKPVATVDMSRSAGLEGARPRALTFSPNGTTLFAGTGRGAIAVLRQ